MSTQREKLLSRMLDLIKRNPGIRPSELNKLLGVAHSAHIRNKLIRQGFVRKEKDGAAVRYYPVI